MKVELREIPGLEASGQTIWKIRALAIEGKSTVLNDLLAWSATEKQDYRKIMKVLRIVGRVRRVQNPKHVKKSSRPKHEDIYEIRADKSHARLMFFYSEEDDAVVVCTNTHWKGSGNQDASFDRCAQLRVLYQNRKR
jgi:hypothetical protein